MSAARHAFVRSFRSLGRRQVQLQPPISYHHLGGLAATSIPPHTRASTLNESSKSTWASQFAVEPGTTLAVTAYQGDVDIRNGSDLYAVEVQASGGHPETKASARREREKKEGEGESIRVRAEHSSLVSAHIPERYCSAMVRAPLGAVSVTNITEANLDVRAKKSVHLTGSIRGMEVAVESDGGDISNGVASGSSVRLESRRGAVDMKKVVGNAVRVEAHTAVHLGSLYSNTHASVSCASGNVTLGNVGCSQLLVSADQGDVGIDGASGSLHVRGCRRVKIHLSKDCQAVRLTSVQEEVQLTIEPGTRMRCKIRCASQVLSEDIVVDGNENESGKNKEEEERAVLLFVKGKANTTGRLEGPEADTPESELIIDAPEARVNIAASSWLTSLFKKRKQHD